MNDFIVAIELGSTGISGIAGKNNGDGSIQIFAYAKEYVPECIKKGAIYNSDKTAECIASIIKSLEEQMGGTPIKKTYVGIGGQSMRSVENRIARQFNEETKISQALIDSLMKSNREMPLHDTEILAVEPQEYKVGKDSRTDPVGISAESIEGHFLNIIARRSVKEKIKQCFKQAKRDVADYIVSPLATANVVLTNNEKRSGCALVDFGAETTTVSVYKNNILRHLAVIPLGGNNITKDICSVAQIDEEDAEQLKLHFASAYTKPEEEKSDQILDLDGKATINSQLLENIVEARVYEIIDNIKNQIVTSTYGDKLMSGIVITGGTANMPNMAEAFRRRIPSIEKIRIAKECAIQVEGTDIPKNGTCNTLIGLLAEGKENCRQMDTRIEPQLVFTDDTEEQKKKDEKERAKKVHEEKKRQEEERQKKRKDECDSYIAEAKSLLKKNKFKEAMKRLEAAKEMNISDKEEEISSMEEKIRERKRKNSWFGRFTRELGGLMEED